MENLTINLNEEKAWVTFSDEEWETVWHPILVNDVHVDFTDTSEMVMEICRSIWGHQRNFGIAPTSQMIIGNSVRDNF